MTVVQASGPTPISRVWAGEKVIAEDLTGEDLGDVLELNSKASGWWVLPRDDHYAAAEMRDVAKALDLDRLAVVDLLADDRRAKFEIIGQARLVITNAVSFDQQELSVTVHPVSMVVTDRVLICLAAPSPGFNPARLLADHENWLAEGGVEIGVQILLAAVVRTHKDLVDTLEDASDDLADILFEERPLDRSEQLWAFRMRKALSQLRRVTEPMRQVMADLVEDPPTPRTTGGRHAPPPMVEGTTLSRRWGMLSEQQKRVANAADSLREALSSVFETSLALADTRLNTVMKKLTGWAAIIAVPTLVTGFVGMNVAFPFNGTPVGFWVYLVLMLAASVVLFVIFRRKEWI